MRALVATAVLSFGMIGSLTASHEAATAFQNNPRAQPAAGTSLPAVDGDRERARAPVVEPAASHETQIGTAAGDENVPNPHAGEEPMQADSIVSTGATPERGAAPELSLEDLCGALALSAKAND